MIDEANFPITPWLLAPASEAGTRAVRTPLSTKLVSIYPMAADALTQRGIVCSVWPIASRVLATLDQAHNLLANEAELMERVDQCVHEVVILAAPGDDYDASHSEPQWRRRIYLSVPEPSGISDLRVVEAIIHEAMHLNLTNLEQSVPLFRGDGHAFSPWRECLRPVSGVFHGLYVFTCISRFFGIHLLPAEQNELRRRFIERRLDQISSDLAAVEPNELNPYLTSAGAYLYERLRRIP